MADSNLVLHYYRLSTVYQNATPANAATGMSQLVNTPVNWYYFQSVFQNTQSYNTIKSTLQAGVTGAILNLCMKTAELYQNYRLLTIDVTNAGFQALLNQLVSANLMTSTDQATLIGLGQQYPCLGPVVAGEVSNAAAQYAAQVSGAFLT